MKSFRMLYTACQHIAHTTNFDKLVDLINLVPDLLQCTRERGGAWDQMSREKRHWVGRVAGGDN